MEIPTKSQPPPEKALNDDIEKLNKTGRRLVNYSVLGGVACANIFYYESNDNWDIDIGNPNNFASLLLLGFGIIGGYAHGKQYFKQREVVRHRKQMRNR